MRRPAGFISRLNPARDPWLFAVAVLSLADAGWLLFVTRDIVALTPDATDYALTARSLVRGTGYAVDLVEFHPGLLPSVHHAPELHGILQSFLIALCFELGGVQGALARVPSVLFAALVPLVTFVVTRRAFGNMAGVLAAVLLFAQLDAATFGVCGSDDVGFACFVVLAFHGFERALETGRRRFVALAGAAAALATLMKFTGFVLPFVFVGVALVVPRGTAKARAVLLVSVAVPVLVAAGLYLVRNHFAYGGWGFRVSAIDWLSNEALEAYFIYYDPPPTLLEMWAQFGPRRFGELLMVQLRLLAWMVEDHSLLCVGGPVAFVVVRKERALVAFGVLFTLALLVVVVLPHHVEARYFFALFPFYASAVAGAASLAARPLAAGIGGSWMPRVRALGLSAMALVGASRIVSGGAAIRALDQKSPGCADAARFLHERASPGAVVLSSNPWFVSWEADLPAVAAPTNGEEALITVARHYRAAWALVGAAVAGSADLGALLKEPSVRHALRPDRVFAGAGCAVYRIQKRDTRP